MPGQVSQNLKGIVALFIAHFIWGAMPIYWKALKSISSFEILGHRVIWSAFLTLFLMFMRKNRKILMQTLKERRDVLLWLAAGGFLISFNWGLYIWAVNQGRILETSLGYFINPFISMFFGRILFKEKLNKIQMSALVLAVIGVSVELLAAGSIPLVSIGLALSFGLYGVLKKSIKVKPDVALFIETLAISPFALLFLIFLQKEGIASFPYDGLINILLVGAGILTSVPLIFFAYGAALVPLTTTGFVQYVSPTLSFMLGIFVYSEPIRMSRMITFIFIWTALAVYSTDAVLKSRHKLDSSRV